MAEQDILNTILADLRRTAREYNHCNNGILVPLGTSDVQPAYGRHTSPPGGTVSADAAETVPISRLPKPRARKLTKLYQHASEAQAKSQQFAQMTSTQEGNTSQGASTHLS
ncbi:hypothetical protein [Paenibacillus sp. YPG26]|uniref:hypothetical protein n=1 Tax=Paenibacillus sp. YPG26 TaxID=2878915 RepID=UPI00203EC491|nr:hypothetical protein [Paenibacillus sp. YPG26]